MNEPQSLGIEFLCDVAVSKRLLALVDVAVFEESALDSLIESRLPTERSDSTQSQQVKLGGWSENARLSSECLQ